MKHTLKTVIVLILALVLALPTLGLADGGSGTLNLPETDVILGDEAIPMIDTDQPRKLTLDEGGISVELIDAKDRTASERGKNRWISPCPEN